VGNVPLGINALLHAFNMADTDQPSMNLARCHSNLTVAASVVRRHKAAAYHAEQALVVARQQNDPAGLVGALTIVSTYHIGIAQFELADRLIAEAIASAEKIGDKRQQETARAVSIVSTFYQGHYPTTTETANVIINSAQGTENMQQLTWAYTHRAEINCALGNFDEAMTAAEISLEMMANDTRSASLIRTYGAMALIQLYQGKMADALAIADKLLECYKTSRPTVYSVLIGYTAAAEVYLEAMARKQYPEQATPEKVAAALKVAKRFSKIWVVGKSRHMVLQGFAMHLLQGKTEAARTLMEAGLTQAEACKMPLEVARAHYYLGRIAPANSEAQRGHYQRTQAFFKEVGARWSLVDQIKLD
jgi:tetratricopeptide (TPR) repeat protein